MDHIIDERLACTKDRTEQDRLAKLRSRMAIAYAKLVYDDYQTHFQSGRWQALERQGAQTQRLMWASTNTKDPAHSDLY